MADNKNWWEKVKEHPIYSKVTAGLILAALLAILNQVFSWNIFSSIFKFSGQKYIVPMWYLMVIFVVPLAVILGIQFLKRKKNVSAKKPDWMLYTEDLIFDILWQWKYRWESIDSLRTDELIALCPKCKREIAIDKTNTTYRNSLSLICFNCDFKKNTNGRDFYDFKQLVIREIQGRIRNGEYKDKIKKTI